MIKDLTSDRSRAKNVYTTQLRNALQDRGLQELLRGDAGVFSMRYLFINEYINHITLLKINPNYMPQVKSSKGFNFGHILSMIKQIVGTKRVDKAAFLFVSRDRQVIARVKSGFIQGDYIFYSVMDELKRRHPECRQQMYIIDDGYDKYYYATLPDVIRSMYIAFKSLLKWIPRKHTVIKRLNAMGCNQVASTASFFFHPRILLRTVLMGYSMASMLAAVRPGVIASNDDCMYTRPLKSDAKVVVLQSARMADYLEECKEFIFQEKRLQPDFFLSSGKIFAKLKEQFNEAENVLITGLPRYDILGNASEIYSRTEFLKIHGLNPSSKIVLWTTQCHALSEEENTANFQAIFGALKGLQGVAMIIKQHPAEGEIFTEIIKRYIDESHAECFLAPKDSDTYELLFVSDLVIAKASTTVMEAVALNKPVIILNLSGRSDPVEYVQEGVAIGIYCRDDLRGAILKLLADDSDLALNRPSYVEDYLYKVDGRATERVVDLLIKMADIDE